MLTTCQQRKHNSGRTSFHGTSDPANWFELFAWLLVSFFQYFLQLFFDFDSFFSWIKLLKFAILWIAFKGNSSNVFIHIFLRNVASDYIVVEELLNQVGGLTVEAILLLMNVLPPTRIPCRLLNPWLFFSILAARSSVVPFEEWRQNWVIIFAYS